MGSLPTFKDQPVEVGDLVRQQNERFQPKGPRIPGLPGYSDLPSNATPFNMGTLLEELERYTEQVQHAAQERVRLGQPPLVEDAVQHQWHSDMANWRTRLGHYQDVVNRVPQENAHTLAGADAIYFEVTSPLLDGVFYEELPGILLSRDEKERMKGTGPAAASNKKPNDVYQPFTLGNQVVEYREFQRERWEQLWEDLWKSFVTQPFDAGASLLNKLVTALVVGAGALAGGGAAYVAISGYNMTRAVARPRISS